MSDQQKPFCAKRADVARRAGVSETIVSYVMNNNRYVNEDKRKRVLRAAQELNYTPSNIARALKGKNSQHIIFIVDNTANEQFGRMVGEMHKVAYEKGAIVTLCANRNDEAFVRMVIARRFDGIIISSISFQEMYIRQFVETGNAVVLLQNRKYEDMEDVAQIGTGLYHGMRECVRFLRDKGRRHILYIDRISQRNHFSSLSDNRYRGYIHEMQDSNLDSRIITGCINEGEVHQAVLEHMKHFPVDAVIGRNDKMACIAMKAVLQSGRRVPDDVAVIGYDNSSVCTLTTPTLTSMQMQEENIARTAVETLYQLRSGRCVPEYHSFAARMIVREST